MKFLKYKILVALIFPFSICCGQNTNGFYERSCPKIISKYSKLDDCEKLTFLRTKFGTTRKRHRRNNISCFTYIVSDIEKRTKIDANCLKQFAGYIYKNDSLLRSDISTWQKVLCPK